VSTQYQIAQICLNGHIVTSDTSDRPGSNYCVQCGEQTTSACENCNAPIRGIEIAEYVILPLDHPPAFCYNCGNPYEWTRRQIEAAKDLADEVDNLPEAERERAKDSFVDLLSDNPRTKVAVVRIEKLIGRAGPVAGGAIKEIVTSIATDAAKKMMGL